jgi:hypothetical protein
MSFIASRATGEQFAGKSHRLGCGTLFARATSSATGRPGGGLQVCKTLAVFLFTDFFHPARIEDAPRPALEIGELGLYVSLCGNDATSFSLIFGCDGGRISPFLVNAGVGHRPRFKRHALHPLVGNARPVHHRRMRRQRTGRAAGSLTPGVPLILYL